ncbi:hypothetical protein [Nocardia thraciensis]
MVGTFVDLADSGSGGGLSLLVDGFGFGQFLEQGCLLVFDDSGVIEVETFEECLVEVAACGVLGVGVELVRVGEQV